MVSLFKPCNAKKAYTEIDLEKSHCSSGLGWKPGWLLVLASLHGCDPILAFHYLLTCGWRIEVAS